MLAACRFGSLSTLQPIDSVSYVISTVLGWAVFNEAITAGQVTGILVITLCCWQRRRPHDDCSASADGIECLHCELFLKKRLLSAGFPAAQDTLSVHGRRTLCSVCVEESVKPV